MGVRLRSVALLQGAVGTRRVPVRRGAVGPAARARPARAGVRRLHVDRRDRGRPVFGHLEVRRVRPRRAPVAAAAVDFKRDVHGGRGGCDADIIFFLRL